MSFRIAVVSGLALILALGLSSVSSAAEPSPSDVGAGAGKGEEAAKSGRRQRREVPSSMVLCRGPRGAVYARDVRDGCRNVELDATNLVALGAGSACLLRQASLFDPKSEKTAEVKTCGDVCSAADDAGRVCAVALRRAGGKWETFSADKTFSPGDAALRDAIVACCEP